MTLPQAAPHFETSDSQAIPRRNLLGTLSLASLGILASGGSAAAFTKKSPQPKISVPTYSGSDSRTAIPYAPLPDLPEEWLVRNGSQCGEYLRYLNSLGLRRISPAQVVASHAKQKAQVWNSLPPKAWWRRMGYTLRVVERIAAEMNVSEVEVISAYRSPAYNAHCRGARTGSWHQANIAVDVKFPCRASQVTATARELRDLGLFKGGVGGYWNFTHIDARGQNINW
jgi:hypothetical protein